MKFRKGQMSLEMIIGLVILLVVATVTVTMFLDVFESPDFDEMGEQEIQRECESLCQDWQDASGQQARINAINYCTETFVHDTDGSGEVRNQVEEQGYNSYCQDGVKCFNVHDCYRDGSIGSQELDAEGCVEMMCRYYEDYSDELFDDQDVGAETMITNYFSSGESGEGIGTCNLEEIQEAGQTINTWWSGLGLNEPDDFDCDEII